MDGFDAVFSAILAQIADGAVGNNQPTAAIPAVANDVPAIQPSAPGADIARATSNTDPLAAAPSTADPNAALPATRPAPVTAPANDTKQGPANINAAAAVSLLQAQIPSAPAPKVTTGNVASESQRPAPKQSAKPVAPAATADTSLLAAAIPVAAPVAPVAPLAPAAPAAADALAPLGATAPNAAPIGDSDESDDAASASQATAAGASTSTSQDQAVAASTAGDFLADLNASMGQLQAQASPAATPPQSAQNPQFANAPQPATRKTAPAPQSDASSGTKTIASAAKSDANTTALTRLAANDQNGTASDDKSEAAPAQPTATPNAASAPPPATFSTANDAANSAGALQQPLQVAAAAPAVSLHVAPQTQGQHAATTADLDSLGITIAAKSLDGLKHFDIRLDPPELGRVEVRLSVDDNGKAQASLSVDRTQTLQLLQNDASSLNRALKDAGLNLSDSGLSFSLRGQDRQASDSGAQQHRGRSLSVRALASIDAASQVSTTSYSALSPDSAGVDIRV
jgi:flagellar hook-length control protein FliK